MDDKTKRELHRLIAGGRLSRPELEVMRESVLDEVERREGKGKGNGDRKEPGRGPGRVIRIASWASAAIAAAAAVLLMVRVPKEPGGEVHQPESGDVSPRPVIEVKCKGGTLSACPRASELVFAIAGKGAQGFLSAYAEPIGHEGARVFYFSKEDGSATITARAHGAGVAEHAVRIPAAQRAGRFRVHAFVAQRPLGQEEMQSAPEKAFVLAKARVEVVIIE